MVKGGMGWYLNGWRGLDAMRARERAEKAEWCQ